MEEGKLTQNALNLGFGCSSKCTFRSKTQKKKKILYFNIPNNYRQLKSQQGQGNIDCGICEVTCSNKTAVLQKIDKWAIYQKNW